MTCDEHLNDGPLDPHTTGHVYESTTVSDGRHDDDGSDW